MSLDKALVSEGLNLAKGSSFYGESLEDMTREELIAVAALGWSAHRSNCIEHSRHLDFLFGR